MMTNLENLPKVSFGIINCNRLFYLKSCLESLLDCTSDYHNKEIIIVDNASIENGTEQYLVEKEKQGLKVIRQKNRDPANEFAKGLNTIVKESTGDYIVLLQGDMQFTVRGQWLQRYVEFYRGNEKNIGCIAFDAQRSVTHASHRFSSPIDAHGFKFVVDYDRPPSSGAGDVMYSRYILNKFGLWSENNERHDVSGDSETKMLKRIKEICNTEKISLGTVLPIYPVSIAIYTDLRGTNARVRGNKRYGDYWEAKKDNCYYQVYDYDTLLKEKKFDGKIPVSIENCAIPIGWNVPLDENGNWKKNPIRPESAVSSDYVVINENKPTINRINIDVNDNDPVVTVLSTSEKDPEYLSEWMEEEYLSEWMKEGEL